MVICPRNADIHAGGRDSRGSSSKAASAEIRKGQRCRPGRVIETSYSLTNPPGKVIFGATVDLAKTTGTTATHHCYQDRR